MWFEDLSPCTYFGEAVGRWLRAVGWLQRGRDFSKGRIRTDVYEKLQFLLESPVGPVLFAGLHFCDLCDCRGPGGSANLWVPGNRILYVCPELILHYAHAHEYAPPKEFCDAVLGCPLIGSAEYKIAYLANGGGEFERALRESLT